jgi:predicted PurR-regulated permease PerM
MESGIRSDERRALERINTILWVAFFTALILLALRIALDVFLLVFAGVLMAVFLVGASEWIAQRLSLRYGFSLAAVMAALVATLIGAAWLAAPSLGEQAGRIAQELPKALQDLKVSIESSPWGGAIFDRVAQQTEQQADRVIGGATAAASTLLSGVGSIFITLFVGIFLAAAPGPYRRGAIRLFPVGIRPRASRILSEVEQTLRRWLWGRFLSMLVVGALTWLGLTLLGVPLAFFFGVLAALLDFIPNIGPVIAAVPAVLLAVASDPYLAISVALLYVAIQLLEGYVVTPFIEGRAVELPPVITIATQVFMGVTAGPLGLALATPLAAAAMVVIERAYVEDVLGDAPSGRAMRHHSGA